MWKLLSESGIEDEGKLPAELIDALNESKNVCATVFLNFIGFERL